MTKERYEVHFDKILTTPRQELTEEQKLKQEKRRQEAEQKRKEWEDNAIVVKGIPGKCMVVERGEDNMFMDKTLKEEWENDKESILYYYNDIRMLSGSAGYILKKSNGKILRQVTMRS